MSIEPDVEKIYEDFLEKRWCDGLPIIPPTRERVDRMLEFTDRKPDDSLGKVPPSEDEAPVEAVAINAVMAGCKPEYFPAIATSKRSEDGFTSLIVSHILRVYFEAGLHQMDEENLKLAN